MDDRRRHFKSRPEMWCGTKEGKQCLHRDRASRHREQMAVQRRHRAPTNTAPVTVPLSSGVMTAAEHGAGGFYGEFGYYDPDAKADTEADVEADADEAGTTWCTYQEGDDYDDEDGEDGECADFDGFNGYDDVDDGYGEDGYGDDAYGDDGALYQCMCNDPACARRRLNLMVVDFSDAMSKWEAGSTDVTPLQLLEAAAELVHKVRSPGAVTAAVHGMQTVLCHPATPLSEYGFAVAALTNLLVVATMAPLATTSTVHSLLKFPPECLEAVLGNPDKYGAHADATTQICGSLAHLINTSAMWLEVLWPARVPMFLLGHALRDPATHCSAAPAAAALKVAFGVMGPQAARYGYGYGANTYGATTYGYTYGAGLATPAASAEIPRSALAVAVEFVHTCAVACGGAHATQCLRVMDAVARTKHPELVVVLVQSPLLVWCVQAVAHAPDAVADATHWTVVELALGLVTLLADVAREVEEVAKFLSGANVWAALRTATFVAHRSKDSWAAVAGAVVALLQCEGARCTANLSLFASLDAVDAVCTLLAPAQGPVSNSYVAQQMATHVALRCSELTRTRPEEAPRAAAVMAAIGIVA
jgi:hypothetical protein